MSMKSSRNLAALGLWWTLSVKPCLGKKGGLGRGVGKIAISAGSVVSLLLLLFFLTWNGSLMGLLFKHIPINDPPRSNIVFSLMILLNHASTHHPVFMGVLSALCGVGGGGYLLWYVSDWGPDKASPIGRWWGRGLFLAFPLALFGSLWAVLAIMAAFLFCAAAAIFGAVLFGLWKAARFLMSLPSMLRSRRDALLAAHPEVQARIERHRLDEQLSLSPGKADGPFRKSRL